MIRLKYNIAGDAWVTYFYFVVLKDGKEIAKTKWYDFDSIPEARQDVDEFCQYMKVNCKTSSTNPEEWTIDENI